MDRIGPTRKADCNARKRRKHMVISASRRTDIPAHYGKWFLNRLDEGYALVKHPRNAKRYSRVRLDNADCAVFWTKNPVPFMDAVGRVDKILPCCFQFTLNPYGKGAEPGLPPVAERAAAFNELSSRLGRERMVWRYDPVFDPGGYGEEFHRESFALLCGSVGARASRCVISFLDVYPFIKKRLEESGIKPFDGAAMRRLAAFFAETAGGYGLPVSACAEPYDFSPQGVAKAGCIDGTLIGTFVKNRAELKKDPGQRSECLCVRSADIGEYDSCVSGCAYCYATGSRKRAAGVLKAHDAAAPCISGYPSEDAEIKE